MKIFIGYPPTLSKKGTAMLSQNRQFQWFSNPTYMYPVIMGSAATYLNKDYNVTWIDCITEHISESGFYSKLQKEKPDLFIFETKTPVIKQHWKTINKLKERFPKLKIALCGDHVTSFPKESLKNSKVDYVLTGGDYDFLSKNLADYLSSKRKKLEKGIYYKEKKKIKNTGKFQLKHKLDDLPFINRDLTKWKNYEKEYNMARFPFFYIMSGRDCWWGKCKFCLTGKTKILTNKGSFPIKDIVNKKIDIKKIKILTHKGEFRSLKRTYKREYNGNILEIEANALKNKLSLTSNHKLFGIKKENLNKKTPYFIRADNMKKGDYIAVPKIMKTKDLKNIDVKKILEKEPIKIKTTKIIPRNIINKIIEKYQKKESQRKISRDLKIDRETVKRYISLIASDELKYKSNPLIFEKNLIRFEKAKNYILGKIPLNKKFLRLIGYYLAEGHSFKSKNRPNSYTLGFTFSEKEKKYVEDVVNIFKQIFKQTNISIHHNSINHTIQITIYNSILGILFKNLFGENCYNKKIPHNYLFLPKDKQKELLRGLFRGDGHLRIRKAGQGGSEYILEGVSDTLTQQIIIILQRNNTIPRLRTIQPTKNNESVKYSISLCQQDINQIFPEIKLPKRKHHIRKGKVLKKFILVPIKNIKKRKHKGEVYNLEVDKHHSYIANNLTVSNCSWPRLFPCFRTRSVENVLDEIGMLIKKYNAKEIFDDSGTLMVGKWLTDLCNGLIRRGYNKKIRYSCNMRFNALKLKDYKLMKKAGFRLLKFGLESASQTTLDKLNKGIKVNHIIKGCKMAKKAGLTVHLTMIVGYPWETRQDALKTFELAKYLMQTGKADILQATVLIPYPGTPLWKDAKKNNWFLFSPLEYERYDMREPVLKVKSLNKQESEKEKSKQVASVCGKIYTIFLTPSYILARLKNIKNIDDIKWHLRGIRAVIGHLTDFSK